MRKLTTVGIGLAIATFGFTALAEDAPKAMSAEGSAGKEFGDAGVLNFAAATNLTLAFGSSKPPTGDSSSFSTIGIQPSLDYFVVQNLSIGALVGLQLQSKKTAGATDSDKATTISVGPRLGYNIWFTPGSLGLWPQLGFLYQSQSQSPGGKDGPTLSRQTIELNLPILIHPVKHFHFGVGPFVDLDLAAKASFNGNSVDGPKDTVFGIKGEIAGWL